MNRKYYFNQEQLVQTNVIYKEKQIDYDEAYDFLTARGFAPPKGIEVVNTGSAKALSMVAPSGFMILVVQHIKNHD